jgi:hypothetical protein
MVAAPVQRFAVNGRASVDVSVIMARRVELPDVVGLRRTTYPSRRARLRDAAGIPVQTSASSTVSMNGWTKAYLVFHPARGGDVRRWRSW